MKSRCSSSIVCRTPIWLCSAIAEHNQIGVLQTIELLQRDFIGVRGPVHPGEVVIAWVAGHFEPRRRSTLRAYNSDSRSRILLTSLWILNRYDPWIKRICVVDQIKVTYAGRIELPVCNVISVRAPTPAIAQVQLFLIYPVKCSVDDRARTVYGQSSDAIVGKALDVVVVLSDVADCGSIGRELREHQGRRLSVTAQLRQLARSKIQYPIEIGRENV